MGESKSNSVKHNTKPKKGHRTSEETMPTQAEKCAQRDRHSHFAEVPIPNAPFQSHEYALSNTAACGSSTSLILEDACTSRATYDYLLQRWIYETEGTSMTFTERMEKQSREKKT
ncbi:uncharacterized protein PAC_16826 [Phialocephala subalpina]|uniref:Uncharacterized protein n=1 Tax=Phialocephala subalpina TaxID=576137 RepID=A0A1L7XPF0_9HELO|nr:uncharacterized protein PAC_16826 [Phialocephala subalpina]